MDSAAVLALMTRHPIAPVNTFTIGFGDPAYDELDEARRTAAAFRRRSSRADRHARRHRRRRAAGAPLRRAVRRCVGDPDLLRRRSSRASTSRSACPATAATSCSPATRRTRMRWRASASPAVDAWRAMVGTGARLVPVHARGKGRLSTMALGPEAWFVWRRTVFPDYLLEAVVAPDVLAAARRCRSARRSVELRAARRPAAVASAAMGSASLPAGRHPRESRSRDDGAFARGALPAARSQGDRARRGAAVDAARRCHHDQAAVSRGDSPVGAGRRCCTRPKRGFGVPLRRWFQEGLIGWARDILLDPRSRQRGWTRPAEVAALLDAARARDRAITPSASGRWCARAVGAAARRSIAASRPTRMRVTMLVRCLAMMRGGGETRHLAWMRELPALGVDVDVIAGQPLLFGGARYPVSGVHGHDDSIAVPARRRLPLAAHAAGSAALTMTALHLDEEWFCRAAWRRDRRARASRRTSCTRTRSIRRRVCGATASRS